MVIFLTPIKKQQRGWLDNQDWKLMINILKLVYHRFRLFSTDFEVINK
jgi:hypothetical protein